MTTAPRETTPPDSLFTSVFAEAVHPTGGGTGEADPGESRTQSDAGRDQGSQPGGGASQRALKGTVSLAKPFDPGPCDQVQTRSSQIIKIPAHPAQSASNTKRQDNDSAVAGQTSSEDAVSTVIPMNPVAQPPLPLGLTIEPGKIIAASTSNNDVIAAEPSAEAFSKTSQTVTTNLNGLLAATSAGDAGHASAVHEPFSLLDFSLDNMTGSAKTDQAGDDRRSSSDATGQTIAKTAPAPSLTSTPAATSATPVGMATTPIAESASGVIPALAGMPSLPKNSSLDSAVTPKSTERDSQSSKAPSAPRLSRDDIQANGPSQDGLGSTTIAMAVKASTNSVADVQPAPQTTPAHSNAPAASANDRAVHSIASHTEMSASIEVASGAPMPGVNTAKLMQTLQDTEMRVGVRSAEFGEVSIRSAFSQQQVVAQISAAHNELARAISDHLPLLQAKLDHYGVHASVEVSHTGMSFGSDRDQASARDQKARTAVFQGDAVASVKEHETSALHADHANDGRIDIRA